MNQILVYCVLDKSLELLQRQQQSIMSIFIISLHSLRTLCVLHWMETMLYVMIWASAFYTVVRWHKQGEVDSEYTLHIFLSFWLSVWQKLSNLAEIWRSSDENKLGNFFGTPCMLSELKWNLGSVQLHRLYKGNKLW